MLKHDKLMHQLGLVVLEGRAATAPNLTSSYEDSTHGTDGLDVMHEGVDSLDAIEDKVCIDQCDIAGGRSSRSGFDNVCIDQDNIADGLSEDDLIDRYSLENGGGPRSGLDKVCIDQDGISDGLMKEQPVSGSGKCPPTRPTHFESDSFFC